MTSNVSIIPFESKYAADFKALNLAWLEKYFYVEAKDREILEACEDYIIKQGGYIFFAEVQGSIAGCFSLIRMNNTVYELGKMAVDPAYQGRGIGKQMMQFAVDFGKSQNWSKIVLYSHTSLGPAIHIYRKYGFREVELEKDTPYERSDIKMELIF